MATILAAATAVPQYAFTQVEMMGVLPDWFALDPPRLERALSWYSHAAVETRYSVLPFPVFLEHRPLDRTMELFREHATSLGRRVATESLARAGLTARDVDLLITVSCTGIIIPPLDAILAETLGLRPDVRRLPITELGCAGGGAALSYASDFVRAHPGTNALVVAVELCTLHFQPGNPTDANLICAGLFGDGAAAAVVTGRVAPGGGIITTRSHIIPGTLDGMGFYLADDGFHLKLSKHVPDILSKHVRIPVAELLRTGNVAEKDLSFFMLHPGGRRILERVEEALGIDRELTQPSWDVLRAYGNLSSASVLFVLHEWMTRRPPMPGAQGILAAFGPGLSAELLLLQWNGT